MYEEIQPTQERLLKKGETFDTPLVDKNTNRRLYRRLDTFQTLLRDGKIKVPHNDAGQKYIQHFQGRQRCDVRVTNYFTLSNAQLDLIAPPWQYHGEQLAEARKNLLLDEARAMDFIADFETNPACHVDSPFAVIGSWGGYKSRNSSTAWALRLLIGALERLSILWGFQRGG